MTDPVQTAARPLRRVRASAQFRFLLDRRPVARTAHFALHAWRWQGSDQAPRSPAGELLFAPADAAWLGAMTPKRWARRAVTRNAIRRQVYALGAALGAQWPASAQVVRLRAAFPAHQFPSATSPALRRAVRAELQQLFAQAAVQPPAAVEHGAAPCG